MNSEKLISYRINRLKEDIKSNNVNAINDFWTSVKQEGTPLIEEIPDDKNNVLVTFIYRETEAIENVMVWGSVPGYHYSDNIMEKLLNTDIWVKTYKVRNDVKFKYYFYMNYEEGKKEIFKNSIADPLNLNRRTSIKDEEDPEDEEHTYSFV
ncbi:MAG: DUF3327 domain-containing protein, partial [Clostridium sp.]